MAKLHVAGGHRADYATDLEQAMFSRFLWVIDLEPDKLPDDAPSVGGGFSKCRACSFSPFIDGIPERSQYLGLDPLARTFRDAATLLAATSRGDVATVLRRCEELGARSVSEVVPIGQQPLLPTLPAVFREDGLAAASHTAWGLAEPGPGGPSELAGRIRAMAIAGRRRILAGYLDHAVACEHWSEFVEHTTFEREWESLLVQIRQIRVDELVFAMAYPPCATLQWPRNRSLEARRARMDVHFRVISSDSSLMCAENVSGYTLLNDTRSLNLPGLGGPTGFAIKLDRLFLTF
jgi:hypothetical protein